MLVLYVCLETGPFWCDRSLTEGTGTLKIIARTALCAAYAKLVRRARVEPDMKFAGYMGIAIGYIVLSIADSDVREMLPKWKENHLRSFWTAIVLLALQSLTNVYLVYRFAFCERRRRRW